MTRRRVDPRLARLAKLAVSRCIEVVSDARVKRFWTECPSIRSRSTLYALAHEQRRNIPSASQLLDMADIVDAAAMRMAASAAELREIAADMTSSEQDASPAVAPLPKTAPDSRSTLKQGMRKAG